MLMLSVVLLFSFFLLFAIRPFQKLVLRVFPVFLNTRKQ